MNPLQVFRGASADWTLRAQLRNDSGAPTTLTIADAIAAVLWPGDDRPALATPAVAWTDAAAGEFRVSLSDAQTLALDPGVYQVRVDVTRGGRTVPVAIVAVEVLRSPGEAQAGAVYCTARDMADRMGWVGQLLDLKSDSTGFLHFRVLAREWLDNLILSAYGGQRVEGHLSGFVGAAGPLLPDPWLAGLLDSGRLVLTGPAGRKLVDAVAYYALHLVCDAQGVGNAQMREASRTFRRRARKVVYCTAGIDTNGDGRPALAVWLGNVGVIEG